MLAPSVSVQFSSVAQSCPTLRPHERQASLSNTNSQSLPKPMFVESVMPSSHLILYRPLLLLPPIPPSIRVFSDESTLCMRWPKFWSFSFNISPSNEHPGLISFRMDWLALLGSPRDSQESSPIPQFKSINSSALSFLHSPILTSRALRFAVSQHMCLSHRASRLKYREGYESPSSYGASSLLVILESGVRVYALEEELHDTRHT